MSISPISASSLYQEQINYFLNATRTDYDSVANLLAQYGIKPSGDAQKDLARLQEVKTETAIKGLKSLSDGDDTTFVPAQTVSYPWYSIMYQLGLDPTGNPEQDFREIMTELVEKVQNAQSESEYGQYMGLISLVEDLFIESGVNISNITADSVSVIQSMEILANYNKPSIQNT